jgi:DNA-binding response OmpR family regulator
MLRINPATPSPVLCVDTDIYLTDLLRYSLTREGYAVEAVHTAADALRVVQVRPPAVVVLDAQLPDTDGFTLCRRLRTTVHLPVIMLLAGAGEAAMVKAFSSGADDCLTKPFNMQILSCRIGAVLRGSVRSSALSGPRRMVYRLGSGTFHAEENVVTGGAGRIKLTATQGKILRLLLENEGRVLSAERMLSKVWSFETESAVNVVKSHVSNLRKGLAVALGDEAVIQTVPGVGYMIDKLPRVLDQLAV